jgi:hypothetical protein
MQEPINMTSDYSESLRVVMLDLIGLFLPRNCGKGIMGMSDNFATLSKVRSFVLEHIVTDSNNHTLV